MTDPEVPSLPEVPTIEAATETVAQPTDPQTAPVKRRGRKPSQYPQGRKEFAKWIPTQYRQQETAPFTSYVGTVDLEKGLLKIEGVDAKGSITYYVKFTALSTGPVETSAPASA